MSFFFLAGWAGWYMFSGLYPMDALDAKVQYEIGYLMFGSLACTEISS
jgi:hypothetical protein